jgi:peptidoglycan/xylan/chitin deacetylase (PgdA/CDA1 family)
VSIKDVLDAGLKRIRLPRRAVLLTFDDAYRDFATLAWPLLRERGLPATVFIPTAYAADTQLAFWWDRLYRAVTHLERSHVHVAGLGRVSLRTQEEQRSGLKLLRQHVKGLPNIEAKYLVDSLVNQTAAARKHVPSVLDWNQLRALSVEGVSLAAHSRTHPILPSLSREEIRDEILGSQKDLRVELGSALPVFCYPNGSVDNRVVEVLKTNGFHLAFTTQQGHNRFFGPQQLRLRRTDVTMRTTLPIFKIRMHAVGNFVDRWRCL